MRWLGGTGQHRARDRHITPMRGLSKMPAVLDEGEYVETGGLADGGGHEEAKSAKLQLGARRSRCSVAQWMHDERN